MSKKSGIAKFGLGVLVGGALGVLFAPKSGKETRKELKEKFDILVDKVKNIDVKEVKEELETKIAELKDEIKSLDKETVKEKAKEKALLIKIKAEELVELAKEKGTPVVEKAADDVRKKALAVVKDVEAKLEK